MSANINKYLAEFLGTLLLVLLGVGAAVMAGKYIGFLGVAFAFGFALLLLAYSIGPISGCHINPAVTLGLFFAGRFKGADVLPYILSQVLGGVVGAVVVYLIASGHADFSIQNHGFAANGFDLYSPAGYTALSAGITETIMTGLLVFVVLCTTRSAFPVGFGGLLVGSTLVAIHLVSIPVTNTSVNFARTLGTAIFAGPHFINQLWLFAIAQIAGAIIASVIYRVLYNSDK